MVFIFQTKIFCERSNSVHNLHNWFHAYFHSICTYTKLLSWVSINTFYNFFPRSYFFPLKLMCMNNDTFPKHHTYIIRTAHDMSIYSPSLFMPIARHFMYLQYWHRFLCRLSIMQLRSSLQVYVKSLRTVLLKNPLHPSQLKDKNRLYSHMQQHSNSLHTTKNTSY